MTKQLAKWLSAEAEKARASMWATESVWLNLTDRHTETAANVRALLAAKRKALAVYKQAQEIE